MLLGPPPLWVGPPKNIFDQYMFINLFIFFLKSSHFNELTYLRLESLNKYLMAIYTAIQIKILLLNPFLPRILFRDSSQGGVGKIGPTHEIHLKVVFCQVIRLICHRKIPNHRFRPKNIKFLKNRKICNRNSEKN